MFDEVRLNSIVLKIESASSLGDDYARLKFITGLKKIVANREHVLSLIIKRESEESRVMIDNGPEESVKIHKFIEHDIHAYRNIVNEMKGLLDEYEVRISSRMKMNWDYATLGLSESFRDLIKISSDMKEKEEQFIRIKEHEKRVLEEQIEDHKMIENEIDHLK